MRTRTWAIVLLAAVSSLCTRAGMTDTDLELIDTDPKAPFDFSVDDWKAQLVAGYSKTLPDRGLKAFMPDFNDLRR